MYPVKKLSRKRPLSVTIPIYTNRISILREEREVALVWDSNSSLIYPSRIENRRLDAKVMVNSSIVPSGRKLIGASRAVTIINTGRNINTTGFVNTDLVKITMRRMELTSLTIPKIHPFWISEYPIAVAYIWLKNCCQLHVIAPMTT